MSWNSQAWVGVFIIIQKLAEFSVRLCGTRHANTKYFLSIIVFTIFVMCFSLKIQCVSHTVHLSNMDLINLFHYNLNDLKNNNVYAFIFN